ncbi:MAG: hypothetical protein HOQ22_02685 [Nocardioidaceae bacterium]|nr:hypothetical protein [Nocardioidaceae bacterium]NUS49931.1 hypothetical protein [Nocardioidaceae bacterium]
MLAVTDRRRARAVLADTRTRGSRRRPTDTTRTTWTLVAGTLAALLLLIAAGQYVGSRLAEHQALVDAGRFTRTISGTVVDPDTAQGLIDDRPAARRHVDSIVRSRLLSKTYIRRVKVWSVDGEILYSDHTPTIGQVFPLSAEKLDVLDSTSPMTAISDLSDEEDEDERGLGDRLLEVYTPVHAADGTPLLFEAYLSYDQVRQQREAIFDTLVMLAVLALVALAGVQLLLSLVNLRWLRRRQRTVDEKARAASERDRRLLARSLHDGVVQELVGTGFTLDGAAAAIDDGDVPRARQLVHGAAASVRASVQGVRSSIVDLYPRPIHQGGLPEALEDLAHPLRGRDVEVTIDAPDVALVDEHDRELAEVVHRCAQELLRNVYRHAEATSVEVRVTWADHYVTLVVHDDGKGMALDQVSSRPDHLGLRALADMAAEHEGLLEVVTGPGAGTEVRMELKR